jgi:arylsulfatase A-like enzyme
VLISIDAMRADHLGCYGSNLGLTPNIDAFARDATLYDAAYASSPWTLTSFAAIFSQLPPSGCGLKLPDPELHEWYHSSAKLPDGVPLLSEKLQDAGYATAAELTNGFLTAERGWERGFDVFRNEEDDPERADIMTRAENITRNALSWVRLNRREPFFLWVHYIDPHLPYDSPDTPADLRERHSRGYPAKRGYWYETMRGALPDTKARYQEFCRAMYAEEVRYADRWVGGLLDGLRRMTDFDNSVVAVTTDHGEELFDHDGFEHGHSLHEEVLRVPLLMKYPAGWDADEQVSQTVALIAVAGTFLEVAGIAPEDAEAPPALPLRDGGTGMEVYSEGLLWGVEHTSLTTDDYKVIFHPFGEPQRFEVYDRRRDRSEEEDLSASGEAADLRKRLAQLTRASENAAREWMDSGRLDLGGTQFSEQNRQRLKALGYIGD